MQGIYLQWTRGFYTVELLQYIYISHLLPW